MTTNTSVLDPCNTGLNMPELERMEPRLPTRPPFGVRVLGSLLLIFSVGLVSCQAMFIL